MIALVVFLALFMSGCAQTLVGEAYAPSQRSDLMTQKEADQINSFLEKLREVRGCTGCSGTSAGDAIASNVDTTQTIQKGLNNIAFSFNRVECENVCFENGVCNVDGYTATMCDEGIYDPSSKTTDLARGYMRWYCRGAGGGSDAFCFYSWDPSSTGTCSDRELNFHNGAWELGIDCGGPCPPCGDECTRADIPQSTLDLYPNRIIDPEDPIRCYCTDNTCTGWICCT